MSTISQLDANLDKESEELDTSIPILELSDFNKNTTLKNYNNGITLIFFYMTGCGHCVRFKPAFNSVYKNAQRIFKNIPINIVAIDITTEQGSQIKNLVNSYGKNFMVNGLLLTQLF